MSASWKMALALLAMSLAVADALRIIGGPTDADLNDPDVKKALKFAVDQTISHRNTTFLRKMTGAGSGKQQLVVGMMYILSATMATTNCAKGEDETKCDIHEDQRIAFYENCIFHVWENPGMVDTRCLKLVVRLKCIKKKRLHYSNFNHRR